MNALLFVAPTLLLGGLWIGAAAPVAVPDSWLPFANQRVVSPSGARYVVVRKKGDGITYEYCERRAGAAPMIAALHRALGRGAGAAADIARDPKDKLRHAGVYPQLPLEVLVPDGLDGFLLFDKYANVGRGKVVTWIDGAGKVGCERTLQQVFGEAPTGATASVSSLWWNRGYWIDERARSVVLVAVNGTMREVAIADGAVSTPAPERLFDWAMRGAAGGRALALDLLAERGEAVCKKAMPLVSGTFLDRSEPLALRLRAGRVLAIAGAAEDVGALFLEVAKAPDEQRKDERRYAVRHLPDVLGDAAMPVLRELMRGTASDVWGDAYQAFGAMGERAVETLCGMLAEQGQSPDYRGGAGHALGQIRSLRAVPALREAMASAERYVADAARAALYRTLEAVVERGLQAMPKDVALADIDAALVAPVVAELRVFDGGWVAAQLNERIDHEQDARRSRFLERVRDGVDDGR